MPEAKPLKNPWLDPSDEANIHGFWVPSPDEIEQKLIPLRREREEHGDHGNRGRGHDTLTEVAAWVADHWQEYDDLSDRGFIDIVHRRFGMRTLSCQSILNYRKGARRGTLEFRECSGRFRWR